MYNSHLVILPLVVLVLLLFTYACHLSAIIIVNLLINCCLAESVKL